MGLEGVPKLLDLHAYLHGVQPDFVGPEIVADIAFIRTITDSYDTALPKEQANSRCQYRLGRKRASERLPGCPIEPHGLAVFRRVSALPLGKTSLQSLQRGIDFVYNITK
jgi:hypothetical protein